MQEAWSGEGCAAPRWARERQLTFQKTVDNRVEIDLCRCIRHDYVSSLCVVNRSVGVRFVRSSRNNTNKGLVAQQSGLGGKRWKKPVLVTLNGRRLSQIAVARGDLEEVVDVGGQPAANVNSKEKATTRSKNWQTTSVITSVRWHSLHAG